MGSQRNVSDVTTTYKWMCFLGQKFQKAIMLSRSEAGFSLPCFNFPPLPVLSVSNRPTRQVRVSTAHTNRDQSLIWRNRWWSVYPYILIYSQYVYICIHTVLYRYIYSTVCTYNTYILSLAHVCYVIFASLYVIFASLHCVVR